tara:strand:- start:1057 stop:2724 length:1668 start_codon:yes stop_codon:yes gene_type:complete
MAEITLGTINNTLTQVESNTETTSRGIGSFIDYLKGKEDRDLEALREAKNQQTKLAPQEGGSSPPPASKSGGFSLGGIGKVLAGLSLAKLAPMIGKKLLTRVLGPLAIATFADEIVEYLLPEGFENQAIKDALSGGLQGAAVGFMVGGPLGAAIGAGIGALMTNENFKKAVEELGATLKVQGEALLKEIKPTVIRFKDAFINLFKSLGITPEGVTEGIAKTLNAIGNAAASGVESLTKIAKGEFSGMDLIKGIGFLGTVAAVLMPGKFMKLFGMLAMMAKGGIGKTLKGVLAGGGAMMASAATMLGFGGKDKDMVTSKSGKQFHKDSPQGKMIQNMTKKTGETAAKSTAAAAGGIAKYPKLAKALSVLRKVPLIGGIAALAQIATMNPVTVDGLAKILGGVGGGAIGAALGSFGGPLGTFAGGLAGMLAGETLGQAAAQFLMGKKVDAFGFPFGFVNDLLNGGSSSTAQAPATNSTSMAGGGGPPNRTFVSPSTSGANIKNQVSSSGMSPGAMGGSNVSFSADTNQTINNSNTTQALISSGPSVDLQDQMTAGLT